MSQSDLVSVLKLLQERTEFEQAAFVARIDALIAEAERAKAAHFADLVARFAQHNDVADATAPVLPGVMASLREATLAVLGPYAADAREAMPCACEAAPLPAPRLTPDGITTEDEPREALQRHLRLAEVVRERPLVVIGGIVKAEKFERLLAAYPTTEWISAEAHSGHHEAEALVRRVRDGRIGAVIVLNELLAHTIFNPVVDACRNTDVALGYGAKGGRASMQKALDEIEGWLTQRAQSRS